MPDPLEEFLIDYVDAVGGVADEIEPQVFDVLMPAVGDPAFSSWAEAPQRIAFDPEALPEHPSAQLLTFGSALLDELLARAKTRGQIGLAFLDDVHLQPHALTQRVAHDLVLPNQLTLRVENVRPLYVTHSVFWFEATYLGDEKEQVLHQIAVDRYYGRQVRYLDELLDSERFTGTRRWAFADAKSLPVDRAYFAARDAVVRTVTAEVNTRLHLTKARLVEQTEVFLGHLALVGTIDIHHPDIVAAAPVGDEGDPLAVGAHPWLGIERQSTGDPTGSAPGDRERVEIAEQVEDQGPSVGSDVDGDPGSAGGIEVPGPGRSLERKAAFLGGVLPGRVGHQAGGECSGEQKGEHLGRAPAKAR